MARGLLAARQMNEWYDAGNLKIGHGGNRWNQRMWRTRIFSDNHELQRDAVEEARGNSLSRKMRRGGERTGVRRYLRHPADAEFRLPAGGISLSVRMQEAKVQPDTADSERTRFYGVEQTIDWKCRCRELALAKALQVDGR